MKATDMRSLSRDARHERRVQVIRLRKARYTYEEIATQTGLSRTGVFDICKRHAAAGAPALRDAPSGRETGEGRLLEVGQEALVRKLIADKTPDQLKMPYALWTRAAVKKWLDEDYPNIAARAKAEGAEVHWGDESGLRSDDVRGRGYAPKGETPVIRVNNKRHSLSVISSVTNKGQMRWKIFDGALNANILIDFLRRLIKGATKKVFLILDNLRVHHAKPVKAWLADHTDAIEVFYLPSYSPELNPDEMANADIKQGVTTRAPARTKLHLVKATARHLRSVQRQPERVRKYFEHEPVRYAA